MNQLIQTKLTRDHLIEIFGSKENAVIEIERVFAKHESLETVIMEPNSWAGKELLIQSARMIDLQRGMIDLATKMNQILSELHKAK